MTDKELLDSAQRFADRWDVSPKQAADIGTALEFIDELIDALTAHQWRPIETAPRDGKILVGFPGVYAVIGSQDMFGEWFEEDASDCAGVSPCYPQPTHWKPVTPPEVEK